MNFVISIAGKSNHGKTYFAKLLKNLCPSLILINFSDSLKDICSEVFGINRTLFDDVNTKNAPFSCFWGHDCVYIDDYLNLLSERLALNLLPQQKTAHSIRQLLQYVGTDYVRTVNKNFWVDRVVNTIQKNSNKQFVIADLRFTNEIDELQKLNTYFVQVNRTDAPPSLNTHISENEISEKNHIFNLRLFFSSKDFILLNIAANICLNGHKNDSQLVLYGKTS